MLSRLLFVEMDRPLPNPEAPVNVELLTVSLPPLPKPTCVEAPSNAELSIERSPAPPAVAIKVDALLSKRQFDTVKFPKFCRMVVALASPKWIPEIFRFCGVLLMSWETIILLASPFAGLENAAPVPLLLPMAVKKELPVPLLESVPVNALLAPGLTTAT